ncbi:amidohydrolase family protein [Alteromonas sp. 1_MG-2023]|uniref:amidohydrolase family protein n=1 Tax=Alteromonas sp. 1_MG-2023 TaxID=3062669 RepID=UPI0026E36DEB|nr:amidohydrolase family protein [Alteromonas sp. 1_MG-2023]MDO6565711.1 amidohydrolase family protein [Alteromonas sp. 1_MG-2023]
MKIVDGHLHFFALDAGDYYWLKPQHPPHWQDKQAIAVPSDERNLKLTNGHTLVGYVHVEAGFDNERPWREIRYLEQHAQLPFKSVACIDLCSVNTLSHIEALAGLYSVTGQSSVAGLRHILDEQAAPILAHPKTKHGLKRCSEYELSFDAQLDIGDCRAVKALLNILDAVPTLNVIINHVGAALIATDVTAKYVKQWESNMQALAQCSRVAVKLSGWEMHCRNWQWRIAQKIVAKTVAIFGIERVMLASNFPLSNWRCSYNALWSGYNTMLNTLAEQMPATFGGAATDKLMATNTAKWYSLNL